MDSGDFANAQPKFEERYVMIDFDDTASLSPEKFLQIIPIFESMGLTVRIFTARNESGDNSDIFSWFDKSMVLFSNREQKKDALWNYRIKRSQVAFWIDDSPSAIVDKEDLGSLLSYLNS